jgi:hypothetical protein
MGLISSYGGIEDSITKGAAETPGFRTKVDVLTLLLTNTYTKYK